MSDQQAEYEKVAIHAGHNIEVVFYGRVLAGQTLTPDNAENVSVECVDCYEVILTVDKP